MDKKVLKKILFVLSIVFTILTFVGATYVLFNKGQVSAGYSAVPMLFAVLFITTYNKVKNDLEREKKKKKAIFWVQIVVLMIQFFCVVLLGLEIYGHMNPDNITIEAVILGIGLIINMVCAFYKLYAEKE